MNITILFDEKIPSREYSKGWGFSALIEGRILFDTGCDGRRLLKNMTKMGIDAGSIKAAVISHNHWDHWGGLKELLKRNPDIEIWLGRGGFEKSRFLKTLLAESRIRYAGEGAVIAENVYSTGEIPGRYLLKKMPEQSLVLRTPRGLTVITGCSHPGIVNILETVRARFEGGIHFVLGGTHLRSKRRKTLQAIVRSFRKLGVEKAAPCHCSGGAAIEMFRQAYGRDFLNVRVGDSFEV